MEGVEVAEGVADLWSISPTYYMQLLRRYFCAKKVQTLNLSKQKLSYEKAARKMLMKLTPKRQNTTDIRPVS